MIGIPDGTIDPVMLEMSNALTVSGDALQVAAMNALELIDGLTVFGGIEGDTAYDLRIALNNHLHFVREFSVKVRTAAGDSQHTSYCNSSFAAYAAAAAKQGDTLFAITVTPAEPDRDALQRAHRILGIQGSLDEALKVPSLAIAIRRIARKPHYKSAPGCAPRLPPRTLASDHKRLAANDRD